MSEAEKITMAFDAAALAPLALFVAKSDMRYYLMGLYVTPHPSKKGVIIAATNGSAMALWYDKDGVADEPRIYELSTGLIASAKKKSAVDGIVFKRQVVFMGGRLCVVGTVDGECGAGDKYLSGKEYFVQAGKPVIDGKFPDVWRVMPRNGNLEKGLMSAIAAQYMGLVSAAAQLIRPRMAILRWYHDAGADRSADKDMAPAVGLIDGAPEFMAIVMSCKDSGAQSCPLASTFEVVVKGND